MVVGFGCDAVVEGSGMLAFSEMEAVIGGEMWRRETSLGDLGREWWSRR